MYGNIFKAVLVMALDNGTINRNRTRIALQMLLQNFIADLSLEFLVDFNLTAIDKWLGIQTKENFELICTGEEMEMKKLLKGAPRGTGELLNILFEQVV